MLILAIFDPREAIFAVLELFTCANHPPLKYCLAIGRHNMARIPDDGACPGHDLHERVSQ